MKVQVKRELKTFGPNPRGSTKIWKRGEGVYVKSGDKYICAKPRLTDIGSREEWNFNVWKVLDGRGTLKGLAAVGKISVYGRPYKLERKITGRNKRKNKCGKIRRWNGRNQSGEWAAEGRLTGRGKCLLESGFYHYKSALLKGKSHKLCRWSGGEKAAKMLILSYMWKFCV